MIRGAAAQAAARGALGRVVVALATRVGMCGPAATLLEVNGAGMGGHARSRLANAAGRLWTAASATQQLMSPTRAYRRAREEVAEAFVYEFVSEVLDFDLDWDFLIELGRTGVAELLRGRPQ